MIVKLVLFRNLWGRKHLWTFTTYLEDHLGKHPQASNITRGNQPPARPPGSSPSCQVTLAWMAYLSGVARINSESTKKLARWAQKPLVSRVGYNSTCRGEKNSYPFIGFINVYSSICNDRRGPSCAQHCFHPWKMYRPLVELVGSFTLFSQRPLCLVLDSQGVYFPSKVRFRQNLGPSLQAHHF